MEQLPKRTYKEGGLSKTEQEKATVFFDKLKFYEGTKDMSQERLRRVGELYSNNVEWVEETLGISPRQRVVTIDKINFVDSKVHGQNIRTSNEIRVAEHSDERETMHHLSHEMIHSLSSRVFHINDTEQLNDFFSNVRLSFEHRGKLKMINEAFTQMINLEALSFLHNKKKGPDYITGMTLPYFRSVIIMDEILKTMANKLGKKPEEVRHSLYKSYFKGETVDLKIIEITYGKGSLKLLSEMPETPGKKQIETIAEKFGLDAKSIITKMQKFINRDEIEIIGGIKIQRPEEAK